MTIKGDDGSKYVEVDVIHIHSTEEAVLLNDGDNEEWFPKSVVEDWPDKGETGTAMILEEWAIRKGFI